MIGHPKHVEKALAQGVDMICAQGGEGGGHTGDTAFSILIPAVVDLCKDRTSPLTGKPIIVIAAGGIADGRGLAAALSYGASGVWVGTRFVASEEAGAPPIHKQQVVSAGYDDVVRTLIYSGRPMSVRKTAYVASWSVYPFEVHFSDQLTIGCPRDDRQAEIESLTAGGKIPHEVELERHPERSLEGRPCKAIYSAVRPPKLRVMFPQGSWERWPHRSRSVACPLSTSSLVDGFQDVQPAKAM